MIRRIVVIVATLALMMGTLAMTAGADVHPVSQAQCAPDGVASGAIASRHAIGDPGRPTAPIPTNASGATRGSGGAAGANGVNC